MTRSTTMHIRPAAIPPKETLLAASILRILTDYTLFVVRSSPPDRPFEPGE
jgi:hypothetical protein